MESKARLKRERQEFLFKQYENMELNFPVCFKAKGGEVYRYQADGRFEIIQKTEKNISYLSFGKYEHDWKDEQMNWLRIIISRTQIQLITESDFILRFDEVIGDGYTKFLSNETDSNNERIEVGKNESSETNGVTMGRSEEVPF